VLVFSILTKSGLWYVWALCISYFIGLTTNFWLSRRFVFGIYWQNWLVQYTVFASVALNSLLANLGLLQLLINDLHWNATAARLVSAACVALISFAGHKLYSFASDNQIFNSSNDTQG
nr:GtrA family protein [Nostocaceae cyanobacterium]